MLLQMAEVAEGSLQSWRAFQLPIKKIKLKTKKKPAKKWYESDSSDDGGNMQGLAGNQGLNATSSIDYASRPGRQSRRRSPHGPGHSEASTWQIDR